MFEDDIIAGEINVGETRVLSLVFFPKLSSELTFMAYLIVQKGFRS